MTETIMFADTPAIIIGYLDDQLDDYGDDATVYSRVPDVRPSRFVTVERTGGPRTNLVTDGAQVTVETWGTDDVDAHNLAQLVRGLMHTMAGTVQDGVTFYRINEFSGPAYSPDPQSGHARYVFTVQVLTRGTALAPTGS